MSDFTSSALNTTVTARFEEIAATYPAHSALQMAQADWSYAALNRRANGIAHTLVQQSGRAQGQVAVLCGTIPWQIAAMLAVIKTGQAVVILDASLPDERLGFILADAQANVLLVDAPLAARATLLSRSAGNSALRVIQADTITVADTVQNLALPINLQDPLAIIYTSGSTGAPKGIMRTHRTQMQNAWRSYQVKPFGPHPHGGVLSSLAYAASFGIVLRLLLCGGCIYAYDFAHSGTIGFGQWLVDAQITAIIPPISLIRQWCNEVEQPVVAPSLQSIELVGALVNKADLIQLRAKLVGNYTIALSYGATETLNVANYPVTEVIHLPDGALPAGYDAPDKRVLLMDEQGAPVTPGEVGEIVIRSRYMAAYWRRPSLTQAKFVPDPQDSTMQLFFTGDLGRQAADGCLHITGRKDFMVKIRGYQVELTEVEQALVALAGVQSAAVVARAAPATTATTDAEKELVAYVVLKSPDALTPIQWRQQLASRLPVYMMPARFVPLAALPLTPNGKIDRQALPAPSDILSRESRTLATPYQPPRTPLEAQLVTIWEAVLGVQPVGIADHFLDLGGNSLRAMQVHARLNSQLPTEIPARLLFAGATISELALQITQEQAIQADPAALAQILAAVEAAPEQTANRG